jgi:hypothetical protein
MADLSRHLPLSNRPHTDESAVTGDRRESLADVVLRADVLARTPEAVSLFLTDARLAREFGDVPLLDVAGAIRAGGKRGIRQLTDAVRALLVLAGDGPLTLDPITSGAVALYAATRAPFERRAVYAGNTLRATDAGWEFGHGPAREASARVILDFVLGLADVAPPLAGSAASHRD